MRESKIETALVKHVEKCGGECIKWLTYFKAGLPDRICMLPGGRVIFVETKSASGKLSAVQKFWHARLRRLGFRVLIVNDLEQIKEI